MRALTVIFMGCLLVSGCRENSASEAKSTDNPDDCQRAFARIARINAAQSEPLMGPKSTKEAIEQCRHGQYAQFDPVLRCAMDSKTDKAASSCIDEFMNAMLKDVPPPSPGAHAGEPKGINLLLE